jgi:hypothetical protein
LTIADCRFGLSIADWIVDWGMTIGLSIAAVANRQWQSPIGNVNRQSAVAIANRQCHSPIGNVNP